MNDRPDARNLLETARSALIAEILPALTGASRYTALMVANAIAIAQREIAAGDAPLQAERERLRALLPECAEVPVAGRALHEVLAEYNRRMIEAIRTGSFDGEKRGALLDHLRRTTEAKLAVSNPKLLASRHKA
jgi:uncharacterized protein DUF6285